jgi:hypothetical protein
MPVARHEEAHPMKRMAKKKPAPQRPNYLKLLIASPEGHDHPIDRAARERVQAEADEQRIRELQRKVAAQLGKKTEAFLALEDLRADLSDKRAEAYFNLGFERGLLEGAARASGITLSEQEEHLVRDLSERIAQAQLPPDQAAFVVHELLKAVLRSATLQGRLALTTGAPQ